MLKPEHMSDNSSGEISWASDDNDGESFTDRALESPLKIPGHKMRKKKRTRNLSNLSMSLVDASAQTNSKSPVLNKTANVIKRNLGSPTLKSTPNFSRRNIGKLNDLNDENDAKSIDPPSPILKATYSNKKPILSPRLKLSKTSQITKCKKNNTLLFTTEFSPTKLLREINKPHLSPKHVRSPDRCSSINISPKSPILCTNYRIASRCFRNKLNFTSNTAVTGKTKQSIETNVKSTNTPISSSTILCEEISKGAITPKRGKEQGNMEASNLADAKNMFKIFKSTNGASNISEQLNFNFTDNGYTRIYKNTHNRPNINENVLKRSEANSTNTNSEIKHSIANRNNTDNTNSTNFKNINTAPSKSCNKRILPDVTSPPDERVVKKIKSYFESHFSSHSNTQVSICGSTPQSQKATNSEERILTQVDITESTSPLVSQETFKISSERSSPSEVNAGSTKLVVLKSETDDEPKQRRRYRKDGLAGRLQSVLKKQKNQLFLWQHEIYLASNSNFVVPNSNPYQLFGIKRINLDYGCYLIEAVEVENRKECLILLNVHFGCNVTISENSFLKLFEPFQVTQTPVGTVIVNACKFECIRVKDEKR